jgi:chitobiase/beta-hexosaminidase-like protein/Fn3 domain-containing protein
MKYFSICFSLACVLSCHAGEFACDRVRFFPTPGGEQAMVGGRFEGSDVSRYMGFVTLGEIKEVPAAKQWSEVKFANTHAYRWLRYAGPAGAQGKLGKVEFYAGEKLLAGAGKGAQFRALENDRMIEPSVGYDVPEASVPSSTIRPIPSDVDGPVDVTIKGVPGAVIRYTLDGTWPTAEHGEIYSAPIPIEKKTTISAVAFAPDRTPSLEVAVTYLFREATKPGLSSAHLGNSLTGTTKAFWRYPRTAGYVHNYVAFLRGGALTRELWALASGEYAADKIASKKEAVNRQKGGEPWEEFWKTVGKVDLLTLQPRDFDLEKEVTAEINFIQKFREKSPDLQPWLYCEWVEMERVRPSDKGLVPSSQMKKTFPALTWEESMSAMLLYVEELQKMLRERYHEGKRARIIPAALMMGWIKNRIDHGKFGRAKAGDFYPMIFHDHVHPAAATGHGSANGAYLVDTTWFSAFYREAPEGQVLPVETTFTNEQARIVERLAWDVVKNYSDCGLYEEGKEPCGVPEFSSDGKIITLKSATPGAWFRYTLDGTTPTRTRGYVYCGAISVQPGIQVKAVAYQSGMADSAVSDGPKFPEQ